MSTVSKLRKALLKGVSELDEGFITPEQGHALVALVNAAVTVERLAFDEKVYSEQKKKGEKE